MIVPIQLSDEPFETFGHQLSDMMNEITRRSYYRFSQSVTWEPAVNVYEDQQSFHICAELAGLSRDQIQVEVAEHKIIFKGERPVPAPRDSQSSGCMLRLEINSGRFERCIELTDLADMDTVEAHLDTGFLWIKVDKLQPR